MKRGWLSAVGTISAAVISAAVVSLLVIGARAQAPQLTVDPAPFSRSTATVTNASVFVLPAHVDEITVRGTAGERSTVSVWFDNVLAASGYLVPGTSTFAFTHVPVPNSGWNPVRIEAATWHGVRRVITSVQFGVVNPPFAPAKIGFDARRFADSSDVVLSGSAAPHQAIAVYDSAQVKPSATPRPDAQVVAQLRTGSDGTFRRIASLPTGTHRLWAATLGCAAARCASAAKKPVVIDHSGPPPAALETRRSMRLRFAYEQLAIDVEATVPRDDPIVDLLMQGVHADTIVSALYGSLLINGQRVDTMFHDVSPSFALGDVVTMRFSSDQPLPPGALPVSTGRVIVVDHPGAYQRREWSRDVLAVSRGAYDLYQPLPVPDRSAPDGAATWDHPFGADGGRVGLTLALASWRSSAVIHEFLSLSVFSLLPDVIARLASVAGGLIFAIPMLAYLALTSRGAAPLRVAARVATAVCVSPQVFLAIAAVQPAVDDALNRMLHGNPMENGLIGAVVCTLTLTAVAGFVAYLANRWVQHWWGVVVREASYGVILAGGFFAVASAVTYALNAVAPDVRYTGDWRYLAGVTLSITVVAAVALAYSGFYRTQYGTVSIGHVLITGTIVLLEALPLTFHQYVGGSPGLNLVQIPFSEYVESAGEATFSGTALASLGGYAGLVFDYLRQASILSDFTFGLALIWTSTAPGGNGLVPKDVLRLVLCCYAVAATTSFFLIPVTFILAWLTFPWILNPSPPSAERQREVRGNRPALVQRLLYGTTEDDLITELQDLDEQRTLKKTDEAAFAEQQAALQTALGERIATVRDVFGVAPGSAAQAAFLGAWVGAAFVVAHVLLFLWSETAGFHLTHTAFPLLVLASYISTGAAQFVGPAFGFGACYELIRGRSGLQKALLLAAWVIACSLPSWWLRLPGLASVGALAVETALFYAVLGLTFDFVIARDGAGVRFRVRDLPRLSGLPALSWAGSIIVASLGVALSGLLTHQFQDVVASTITSVYHQAAIGP